MKMVSLRRFIYILVALALIAGVFYITLDRTKTQEKKEILSFEDCAATTNIVMESYPRKCMTEDGRTFVEEIGNELEKMDLIRIASPRPNDQVSSPIKISGEARGFWFFEATFPVVLTDWDGRIIAEGYVSADQEWMTEDFVPFSGELVFDNNYLSEAYSNKAYLILQRNNPSGLPENDDALEIPVYLE